MQDWTTKLQLLTQLQKLWEKGLLLQEAFNSHLPDQEETLFPKRLSFKSPNSQALSNDFDAVRRWIIGIKKIPGFRIEYRTVQHRIIGENSIPHEAWVDTLEHAVQLLHKQKELSAFMRIKSETAQTAPQLIPWLKLYPLKALSLADDWSKLLLFVQWRQSNPSPNIYLRQVSLPGINSKFIEQHRAILAQLLELSLPAEQISKEFTGVKYFALRYGFRHKPERVRFRLLDSKLSDLSLSDADISLTISDFIKLSAHEDFAQRLRQVYITENEINFLSFPAVSNSLIIFGSGYGFDALAQAKWLQKLPLLYWGDIDTHGFAILDQLRSKFPHVKSLLMDESTLLSNEASWGYEAKPETKALARLTNEEQKTYQALVNNTFGENLRLEQEHIDLQCLSRVLVNVKPQQIV